ncbi:MAG: V-type ATPase subunit [Coriobacteriia bacterium]|nr:V-type ATPase subunit [Coriobacteriia bacterium]
MPRRGDDIRYGFAVGRVMVLRTRLLGRAAYERLLDAPTFAEQKRVLSETHFGRFIEGTQTGTDVERAIDESLLDLHQEFLESAGLPEPVVAFFRAPYDFAILKAVLKARMVGVEPELPSVALGAVPLDVFAEPAALPGPLGETARELLSDGEAVPEALDAAVDRAMFAELQRLARLSRVPFLATLAAREADVANAKVLLRCALARRTPEAALAMLVPGGRWDAASLADLVRRPDELAAAVMVARVLPTPAVSDLLDVSRLDVLADGAIAALAREASLMGIGPEQVLGYVLARRAEAVTVRSLLVGRLAGLSRDTVAGRLREAVS